MATEQTGMEITQAGERLPAESEGQALTPLERALERGLDVDVIERLVALQERREERDAEVAMAEALAAFQAECPPIPRTGTADVMKNGQRQYGYTFAPLDEILRVIRPVLAKHHLSLTFDTEVGDGWVKQTAKVQHKDGGVRTATFSGPFDNSGGKNPLQAVGSSRSYGKRYAAADVLGLATEEDDDGVGSHGPEAPTINKKQLAALNKLADEAGANKAKFCEIMAVESMADIPAAQFKLAELTLRKKIEQKEADDA